MTRNYAVLKEEEVVNHSRHAAASTNSPSGVELYDQNPPPRDATKVNLPEMGQ